MNIGSNTVMPYCCLVDEPRTRLFQKAIEQTVKPGDVVLEGGAGTGILSFVAARAGARKVVAVEIDPVVAAYLRKNARANGFEDVIEVIEGDVRTVTLDQPADVFIGEMIETGLMDEMQVPAINALRESGAIGAATQMIPFRYRTFIELGAFPFNYYGFDIKFPVHDWSGAYENKFRACSVKRLVDDVDFRQTNAFRVDKTISLTPKRSGTVNAIALSGFAHLREGLVAGESTSINGRKIIPIDELRVKQGQTVKLRVTYEMGHGMGTLQVGPA